MPAFSLRDARQQPFPKGRARVAESQEPSHEHFLAEPVRRRALKRLLCYPPRRGRLFQETVLLDCVSAEADRFCFEQEEPVFAFDT